MRFFLIAGVLIVAVLALVIGLLLFLLDERRATHFEVRRPRLQPSLGSRICPDAPQGTPCPTWRPPRFRGDLAFPPRLDDLAVTHRVEPQYPEIARKSNISGTAVLMVGVRRDGSVGGVCVVHAPPCGLGAAAETAVRQWRFEPPLHGGEPADVVATVSIPMKPAERPPVP